MLLIRHEQPRDVSPIRLVNEDAFGSPAEADLVDALRANRTSCLSLVAELEQKVVGHILFSPVTIDPNPSDVAAVGLAPMAVLSGFQKKGIGSALVRRGLEACGYLGYDCVVVVGHPGFYSRFGFCAATQHGLSCEYDVPSDAFMAVELRPGALKATTATVIYPGEFKLL